MSDFSIDSKQKPTTILFICTGNTCRSPMAKALLEQMASGLHVDIISAGLRVEEEWDPKRPESASASDHAMEAIHEIGGNLRGHTSRQLTYQMIRRANCILVMSQSHRDVIVNGCPEVEGHTYLLKSFLQFLNPDAKVNLNVQDPWGEDLETYRACRDEIQEALYGFYYAALTDQVPGLSIQVEGVYTPPQLMNSFLSPSVKEGRKSDETPSLT